MTILTWARRTTLAALPMLACACISASAPPPVPAPVAAPPPPTFQECRAATLGLQVVDGSRALRRANGVPADVHGVTVIEILADGPAAKAGMAVGDLIAQIGLTRIHGSSGYIDAEGDLLCDHGVELVTWRGAARQTRTVQPIDARPFYRVACESGSATACFRSGWLAFAGGGAEPKDAAAGERLYRQACEMGSGIACAYWTLHHWDEPDFAAERFAMVERSCALHDPTGCTNLAFYFATGKDGKPRDDARATPVFVAACDGGDPNGCYNVGLMYEKGRGVAADLDVARAAYEDGCDGRSEMACENLGLLYQSGRGVPASAEKAAFYFDLACRGTGFSTSDTEGCLNLGRAYRSAEGVERNLELSAELFDDVCGRRPIPGDPDSGPPIAEACFLFGEQLANGEGLTADPDRATASFRKACLAGLEKACERAPEPHR